MISLITQNLKKSQNKTIKCKFVHDKCFKLGENKFMINDKETNKNCNVHVMPPQISDDDINALFSGIITIMKKKIELETKASVINANSNFEKILAELKAKQAECNRLKNEIIFLKSKLNEQEQ